MLEILVQVPVVALPLRAQAPAGRDPLRRARVSRRCWPERSKTDAAESSTCAPFGLTLAAAAVHAATANQRAVGGAMG